MKGYEAAKAMEDGKKIRNELFDEGLYFYSSGGKLYDYENKELTALSAKFLFSEGWEIIVEPVNFQQALAHMKKGNMAKRENHNHYILIRNDCFLERINGSDNVFSLTLSDIEASDWELL